jgi:diaminopimelate decarboxylase
MTQAFHLSPWQDAPMLEDREGRLHMDGVDLVAVAEQHGTPLFVYSEARLRENARGLSAAFGPGSTVCFASKACANLSILRLMEEEGVAIEVNSGGELAKAKHAGFDPGRIVFNGVAKSHREIVAALDPPIKAINVDSVFEMQRIADIAAERGVRANVALRAVPHVEGGSTASIETGSTRSKFGLIDEEIESCLEIASSRPDSLCIAGLHFHIGSQMTNIELYAAATRFVCERAAKIRQRFPDDFVHINIGGGFPVSYVKYDDKTPEIGFFHTEVTAADVAREVRPIIDDLLGANIEILTEPGRSMTTNACVVLSRVENIKQRGDTTWLYIDAGYSVISESDGWYFHMITANRTAEQPTRHFRVVGPLCDSTDVYFDIEGEAKLKALLEAEPALATHRDLLANQLVKGPGFLELPAATGAGDLIAILDTGSYQIETTTHYCGRARPAVLMVRESGEIDVIRRADRVEDLWSQEENPAAKF